MKKILSILLLTVLLASCTTQTEYGKCIGAFDERKPNLVYKTSSWNIIMGIIFIETIFVPVVVVLDSIQCPIDNKEKK